MPRRGEVTNERRADLGPQRIIASQPACFVQNISWLMFHADDSEAGASVPQRRRMTNERRRISRGLSENFVDRSRGRALEQCQVSRVNREWRHPDHDISQWPQNDAMRPDLMADFRS